ncbi:tRNA (adenosine(37)-N6)-dimethylallyltransferase MiaA [Cyclobacterium plantarum]|uniref:tRNA dimethylallyltransferase n=1 Tax=Cyclobacterium plantarum TaxID=2716263 RepID=A0ABX0H1Q8_9BACT|nr:tRNA (adenosine(37)-N6)-dimethylallyltransferase MiaA [Cyclobacterium plantarum]NHE55724.1 tRNA (adenosine(37)-N6)-dimethylallyltransferase MiaA [Cyclobacterium plantarum]
MTPINKILLVVAGPTAVGKTDLCINLAKKFNTSIISSDSRQFFREMNVGTAKPGTEDLKKVPHFFIDNKSIHDPYDVKAFEKDALHLIGNLFIDQDLLVMTGGSGLYIDAVVDGLDEMPETDQQIREELNLKYRNGGLPELQNRLLDLDPEYFQQVDLNNPQRLIRALEVCLSTGKPFSRFRKKSKKSRPFRTLKIALSRDREELYARIDQRMDEMIRNGLFEEAAQLYPYRELNALQTVGYKEIFGYLDREYDREEAIRLLKRNSRRYAKRQLTWLRRDPDYVWFHPQSYTEIQSWILAQISR